MKQFLLTFVLMMWVFILSGQQVQNVKSESPIDFKFSALKKPLEKEVYKTITTKVTTEKILKNNVLEHYPVKKPAELHLKKYSVVSFPERKKTHIEFTSVKTGDVDILNAPSFVFKDNSRLNLKYLDKAHGFYSNTINFIEQDKSGIIWLASAVDGLCRFDGISMEIYTAKSGLPSNNINCIFIDSNDKLWIGTQQGLCYIQNQKIYYLSNKKLATSTISCIAEDKNGGLWFGTTNYGAYHYQQDSLENYNQENGLPGNHILSIFNDLDDNMWFGFSLDGFCKYDGDHFYHYETNIERMEKHCQSFYENEAGLWIGFFSEPILNFDGHDFYQYQFTPKQNHTVSSIIENEQGLWFVDYGLGLIRYINGEVIVYSDVDGLTSKSSIRAMLDMNNNIWVAHLFGGISRLDENIFEANNPEEKIPLKVTEGILKGPDNNLWYLPNGGRVVREDEDFYTLYSDESKDDFPPFRHSFDMEFLENGNIVYATYSKGICFSDFLTNKYHIFEKGNYVIDISRGADGSLWFATMNNGLIKYDGQDFYFLTTEHGLSSNQISSVFCNRQGLIWVGTTENGLNIIWKNKISSLSQKNGLSSNTINCFFEDDSYRIWVGTENGIDIIGFYETYHLSKSNGLVSNKIRSITQDARGYYWVATADGLSQIKWTNGTEIQIRNFNKNDGINITDFNSSVLSCDNGNVIWGTNSNILTYYPADKEAVVLPIRISFDQENMSDTVSDNFKIENGMLKIKPDGQFKLSFAAIHWGKENEITYQYAIVREKGDTSWVSLGSQNSIVLRDFPKGEYTILIKAKSGHLESQIIHYHFEFLPFWWQTNFILILFSSVFLFLGPYIFYRYSKRAQRIQQKLEKIVSEKTGELIKENKIKDALVQEIHHRVKNNLQSISSLVDMQLRSLKTEAEKKALTDTQLRIGAMALVHEMLYASQDLSLVSVKSYLDELVTSINEMTNTERLPITFKINTHDLMLSVSDCISFGILTSEILSNSIKYAFEGIESPQIAIDLQVDEDYIYYCIKDNGIGMNFENQENSSSLGLRLVDVFARQLNGQISIENNQGLVISLKIPLKKDEKL